MKLYIPACGDRLRLTEPWEFRLIGERRNLKFAHFLGLITPLESRQWGLWEGDRHTSGYKSFTATLPAGDVLEVDRVYIRLYNKSRVKDENDYDSVSFKLLRPKGKSQELKSVGRFWVKLTDSYNIWYSQDQDDFYRVRVKLIHQILGS